MSAPYEASIAVDAVIEAVQAVVTLFLRGGMAVRGQVNRVPLPSNPCCVLTEVNIVDLQRPTLSRDPLTEILTIQGACRVDVQADFYGVMSQDIGTGFVLAFRSSWANEQFPADIQPLYVTGGTNAPLVTGEQQYENRWVTTLSLQYNPAVTVPQQSAIEVEIDSITAADLL